MIIDKAIASGELQRVPFGGARLLKTRRKKAVQK
jgi:hypothetical protein